MGLWYPKGSSFKLTAFSDVDHAGCIDSCKSTSGGIQFLSDKVRFIITCLCTNYKDLLSIKIQESRKLKHKDEVSTNSDKQDLPSRNQVYQGRLLASFQDDAVGNKIHKAFPLLVRKFPLPEGTSHCLKMNATVIRIEMPLPEVCTTIEEKKKKLPVKDRWQLH
nr:retrovirus-related Pol polyprotein from transposon TNT 1-94 [Tanacetum cinerariifolium]